MIPKIYGSGGTPPLMGKLIENAKENIERPEQGIPFSQENGVLKFNNGSKAEFPPQETACDGAMHPTQQGGLMQKLLMLIGLHQLLAGAEKPLAEKLSRQPESSALVGQPSSLGGVNGLIQQMMLQLMQMMQQLAGAGQKNTPSGEGGNVESNGSAQLAQKLGGNMLSKLLGPLLQMVGLDVLMSKLGGAQNNRG
ncbi:hypothetical protein N5E15_21875 [Pantoea stewartii]|uniref:hypothetical protein n=1 Tax=Pantoea stewartii TaxID=66269 RepID=UPI0021D51884|nr:hypothetical protein [Pantoea stewartii]MCU7369228.1 hypothetical protein [Pantoea stewartii]